MTMTMTTIGRTIGINALRVLTITGLPHLGGPVIMAEEAVEIEVSAAVEVDEGEEEEILIVREIRVGKDEVGVGEVMKQVQPGMVAGIGSGINRYSDRVFC